MTLVAPDYIKNAGIIGAPLDLVWNGPQAHIGPVETVNKMFNLIASKTTCGMLTQAAGIIGWGAWRLKGHTDVTVLLKMIEASFAFQVHPHYVDADGAETWDPEDEPAAESAAAKGSVHESALLGAETRLAFVFLPVLSPSTTSLGPDSVKRADCNCLGSFVLTIIVSWFHIPIVSRMTRSGDAFQFQVMG